MVFSIELQDKIKSYVYGHLPEKEWYDVNFYPFIKNTI